MINYSEALQEAERMKTVTDREVEVKAVNCDCDYSKLCYLCAGQGTFYELVYAFCDHTLKDDDRDEECWNSNCAAREKLAVEPVDPFSGIEKPLLSLEEVESEREAQEAA